jgi:hypothetical protein
MSNESENEKKYWYSVTAEKRFGYDSDDIHSYILGAWEDKMPASTMEYWGGHGQAFGFRKLTLKNIFKGRRARRYVASYDVSFNTSTLEDATKVFESLQYLTNDDSVNVRLGVYPNNEEE